MRPWQNIHAGKDWVYEITVNNFMYHTLRALNSPACHQDSLSRANTKSICFFICSCSGAQLCPTLCNPMDCSMPSFPVHHQILGRSQAHVHWVGDAIQPSHPLLSPSPPAFNLSQHQGLFKSVSSLHLVAKLLEFHFSFSLSNEYSGLISFRIDWLDLLAVKGTLKSLLQHHSSNAPILRCSAFFYSPTLTSIHDY